MRKTLLSQCFASVLLLLCSVPASAEEKNSLVIHMKNGVSTTVLLDELPLATFSGGRLKVSSATLSLEIPRNEVARFVYTYTDPSELTFHRMGIPNSSFVDDVLSLSGLQSGTVVRLYFDNGRLLDELSAPSDGRVSLPLMAYPSGVYILQIDGVTYKFTKL